MSRRLDWGKSNKERIVRARGSEPVGRGFEHSAPEPWIPATRIKRTSNGPPPSRKQRTAFAAEQELDRKRMKAVVERINSAQIKKAARATPNSDEKAAIALIAKRKADRAKKKAAPAKSQANKSKKKAVRRKKRMALGLPELAPDARVSEISVKARGRLRSVVVVRK